MDLQSINKPVHIAGYEIPFWNLLLIIGGAVAFISMFMDQDRDFILGIHSK